MFNKGDKVEAIEVLGYNKQYPIGTIGIVASEPDNGFEPLMRVTMPDGYIGGWYQKRFKAFVEQPAPKGKRQGKPVAPAPAKQPGVFAAGDLVTITPEFEEHWRRDHGWTAGKVYTVNSQMAYEPRHVNVNNDNGKDQNWYIRCFQHYVAPKKAKPEPRKLEPGCTVACIDASDSDILILKRRYKVAKVNEKSVQLEGIKGVRYHPRRFKVVVKAPALKDLALKLAEKVAQFDRNTWLPKKGERVFIIGKDKDGHVSGMEQYVNDGKEYEISIGGSRPWVDHGDHNWYWTKDALLPVWAAKGYKAPPAPPPPPPLPKPTTDLREETFKKAGGTCSYSFEFADNSRIICPNQACHAALGYGGYNRGYQKDVVALDYCIRYEHQRCIRSDEQRAKHKRYVEYIIKDSPWAHCFMSHDVEDALKNDLFMNVQVNKYQMAGACLALRVGSEYKYRLDLFCLLLDKGYSPHTCWLLSCGYQANGVWGYSQCSWDGGHDVMDKQRNMDDVIKFFKTGYHNELGLYDKPFAKDHGRYVIADAIGRYAGGETINTWLDKNVKGVVVGKGFNANKKITFEAICEAATLLDNLLKKDEA